MTAEQRLRFATDELERANRDAENKRLAWLVARVAHPAVLDMDLALEYAEAANVAAELLKQWELASIDAQAEYFAQEAIVRRGEADIVRAGHNSASPRRAIAEAPAVPARWPVSFSRED